MLRRREDLGQLTGDVKRRITSPLDRYGLEPPVESLYSKRGLAWLKAAALDDDRDVMLRHYAEQLELLEAQKAELEEELVILDSTLFNHLASVIEDGNLGVGFVDINGHIV